MRRIFSVLVAATALVFAAVAVPAAHADSSLTFGTVGDATVRADQPNTAIGGVEYVRALSGANPRWGLMKFTVAGVDPADGVSSATLSLSDLDTYNGPVSIYSVSPAWDENTVTWNTRPALGALVATATLTAGATTNVNVGSAVTGNGDVAFAITTTSTSVVTVASKENLTAALRPKLAVQATTPILWGSNAPQFNGETAAQAVTREESTIGGNTVRIYSASTPAWPTAYNLNGQSLVYSWHILPSAVLAGNADSSFVSFLNAAVSYIGAHPAAKVWWSYYHEPEDNIAAGTFTAADYRAAWGHLITLAHQTTSNSHVSDSLILMGYTLNPASHRTFTDYYNSAVDSVTYDPYKGGSIGEATVPAMIDPIVTKANAIGKPWGIAETGVSNTEATATRQADLTALSKYIADQANRPIYALYFDGVGGTVGEWTISNNSTMYNAWRSGQAG